MKLKEIITTACVCVLLIAAGTVGFSFLYQTFFHLELIIKDSSVSLTEWQEDQAQFEKEVLYPFSFYTGNGTITITSENSLLSDLYHINQDEYSSALKLADLDWVDLKEAVTLRKAADGMAIRRLPVRFMQGNLFPNIKNTTLHIPSLCHKNMRMRPNICRESVCRA